MNHTQHGHTLAKGIRLLAVAALLAGFVFAVQPARPAYAATLTVTTTTDELNTNGNCSLREAITNANNNATTWADCAPVGGYGADTITFAPATNGTPIVLAGAAFEDANASGDLDILAAGGNLDIIGADMDLTIIDGNGTDRVFHIDPAGAGGITVNISNVEILNGSVTGEDGGGIYNNGDTLTLTNVAVTQNTATPDLAGSGGSGGGIYNGVGGQVNISNGGFWQNTATGAAGGGLANYGNNVSVTNSRFSGNTCPNGFGGGGLYAGDGTINVNGCTFINNRGFEGGGIATRQDGMVQLRAEIG